MKYTLLNQKYGIPDDLSSESVKDKLIIKIENEGGFKPPMTMRLVNEDKTVYFARIEGGQCAFRAEALRGRLGLCVVSPSGTIPCMSLVATRAEDGSLLVFSDPKEVLTRLSRTERDISDAIAAYRSLEAKYNGLMDRIQKLFSQNYY